MHVLVIWVQLSTGKILKTETNLHTSELVFASDWRAPDPTEPFVFTCREKVSCRSVSVSPAEDSRISLERRIRLEPWGGDRRRTDGEKKRDKRERECHYSRDRTRGEDGKITISVPQSTPAESIQWILINRMLQEKRQGEREEIRR